ncbi:divergent polysaccharide deacetylase family protein [Sulfitobacter sp. F26204]|uniref:divergent polysaccharide deacetylase family protein n=1 Tax=Sulfitobacter sp. F26204 TaxID=2996014 RepID=UPI00225DDBA1|nr:divergent polysaccharide deacetylase family protein [Sulfitobacter sp. F26204]MCX7559507.1 divergent polysaccharide deacetylase family protein [Sulfitobacter sp. F26204]
MAVGLRSGGFLGGALLGGALSLGAGSVLSVMVPLAPVQAPEVSDIAPSSADAPGVDAAAPLTKVTETAPQPVENSAPVTAPDQDTLDDLEETTTAIAPAPVTDDVAGLEAPEDLPHSGSVVLSEEDPVFPNPQALAPMLPQDLESVEIDTAPADPPQPPVTEATSPERDAGEAADTDVAVIEDGATPSEDGMDAAAPLPDADAPEVAQRQEDGDAQQPVQTEGPDQIEQPEQTEQAGLEPVEPPANVPPAKPETTVPDDKPEGAPKVAMLGTSARPQIGTPAISLTDRSNGVTVNRLGNSGGSGSDADPVTVISQDGSTSAGGDQPPLSRFAQPFANTDNKPLMSIVLIDDGSNPTSGAPGIAALRSFPYTLSFAVDSALPDAVERMALYRKEGFEVLALVNLPQGAQATDVETTLGATLAQMNEVVGLLEGTEIGLQSSREVSDQVTAILAQTGHGLVTMDKGLNTMPKLARKEGVPADPVFRDFDSKGQTATVIRRFLDQAAFKAGQEGAVIMLGRVRPDTISALLLWGLQDRAGQVALAPISALLLRGDS